MPRVSRSRRKVRSADRTCKQPSSTDVSPEPVSVGGPYKQSPLDCMEKVCEAVSKLSEKIDLLLTEKVAARRVHRETGLLSVNGSLGNEEPEEASRSRPKTAGPSQIDATWFMTDGSETSAGGLPPNPWLQRLTPAATIEVFDGDPKQWPRFIAGFKSMVHDAISSDADRLAVLSQLLSPRLREGFAGLLYSPSMYKRVLQDLHALYGNEFSMVKSHADALGRVQPLRSESLYDLERFYLQINGPVSVLESSGWHSELNSVVMVGQISDKLTARLKEQWSGIVQSNLPKSPNLLQFTDWLRDLVMKRRLMSTASELVVEERPSRAKGKQVEKSRYKAPSAFSTAVPSSQQCVVCGMVEHDISACPDFAGKDMENRLTVVRRLRLCLVCLKRGHSKRDCESRSTCTIENCKGRHHNLLHGAPRLFSKGQSKPDHCVEVKNRVPETSVSQTGLISSTKHHRTACAVVPIRIMYGGVSKQTYALLDSGAEVSLMSRKLGNELNMPDSDQYLDIRTIHGISRVKASGTTCSVSSLDGSCSFVVEPMIILENLDLAAGVDQMVHLRNRWKYLHGLPLTDRASNSVQVLIGMNVPAAHRHYDIREPPPGVRGPIGVRTPFGWTIVGHVPDADCCLDLVTTYFVGTGHVCSHPSGETVLKQQLERFWCIESYGTESGLKRQTKEESMSNELLRATTRFNGERYEVGLLWKSPQLRLPNNRDAILRRFFANERRVMKEPTIAEAYERSLLNMVALGHARRVSLSEIEGPVGRTWFLPHHAVVSETNPSRVRVVFDASARYKGLSLNDCLMKGPDFLVNLPGLLLKFRRRLVPLSADIESMYHQVCIPESERSFMRFFWRKPGSSESPAVYEMCVHVFGVTCSPSICMHALRRAAEDQKTSYPTATEKILHNMYVDNLLDSVDTVDEAKTLYREITSILKSSGFRLRKWMSSSRELLLEIPRSERAKPNVNLVRDELPEERTLGLNWDCEADGFRFHWTAQSNDRPTKRSILSIAARVFDPLGLIAPVTVVARVILQDIWKSQCGWDDTPAEQIVVRWKIWLSDLSHLSSFVIPRCIIPKSGLSSLHVFCDASKAAYGAAAYMRVTGEDNIPHVALVMARSKVAPLRQLTIPRLELQAAVVAMRLACLVTKELEMPTKDVTFWTDSSVVLYWLKGTERRFSQFVENRVSEILSASASEQWRFVPGRENPADDLSRGLAAKSLDASHKWFQGPQFLRLDESKWPVFDFTLNATEGRVLEEHATVCNVHVPCTEETDDVILNTILRVSELRRLLRVLRLVLRFRERCSRSWPNRSSDSTETWSLKRAWTLCVYKVQTECFAKELRDLGSKQVVHYESRLRPLNPFLDVSGIIRVGGRLKCGHLTEDAKHPPILPSKHHLTTMLIQHVHALRLHSGTEDTLAELRAHAWVINARAAVRKVIYKCVTCRKGEAKPVIPPLAQLPSFRIERPTHVFAATGVDYFGPILVVERRSTVKRWLCLFTCMAVRAIHMEVSRSLDADAFLCAFRRFAARRGMPSLCISDNGTNFIAAQRELAEGIRRLKSTDVEDYMNQRGVRWQFNPPGAPHFGGAWERLVRSAKRALKVALKGCRLTDEILETVVVEVEGLLNGRPLTHVSQHPEDPEPLTPNHFLLGRPYASIPPDVFHPREILTRRYWKAAQVIVNQFWRRWLREYLPALNQGQKQRSKQPAISLGDVVLIVEVSNPRGTWPMGEVEKLYPGSDGQVRVVDVRTKSGIKRRPTTRLVKLFNVFTPQ